jgi:hypothetical protein
MLAPRVPVEKFSRDRTGGDSRGTDVPPDVRTHRGDGEDSSGWSATEREGGTESAIEGCREREPKMIQ